MRLGWTHLQKGNILKQVVSHADILARIPCSSWLFVQVSVTAFGCGPAQLIIAGRQPCLTAGSINR
jgi:hypothetical protein